MGAEAFGDLRRHRRKAHFARLQGAEQKKTRRGAAGQQTEGGGTNLLGELRQRPGDARGDVAIVERAQGGERGALERGAGAVGGQGQERREGLADAQFAQRAGVEEPVIDPCLRVADDRQRFGDGGSFALAQPEHERAAPGFGERGYEFVLQARQNASAKRLLETTQEPGRVFTT